MKKLLEQLRYNFSIGGIRLSALFMFRVLFSLIRFYLYKIVGLRGDITLIGKGVQIQSPSNIKFTGYNKIGNYVKIVGKSKKKCQIGFGVSIGDNSIIYLSSYGTEFGNGFEIGSGSTCAEFCVFGAAGGLKIGSNVIMGQNVRIHSENHNFDTKEIPIKYQGVNRKGVRIGDDVWIGSGCVILDGVEIKNGTIIGANSVITKSTMIEYGIYGGNPAKLIRER